MQRAQWTRSTLRRGAAYLAASRRPSAWSSSLQLSDPVIPALPREQVKDWAPNGSRRLGPSYKLVPLRQEDVEIDVHLRGLAYVCMYALRAARSSPRTIIQHVASLRQPIQEAVSGLGPRFSAHRVEGSPGVTVVGVVA